METLNYGLLNEVRAGFQQKHAFVPMPGGQSEPVAGSSQATAALTSGGMGAPQGGGDPSQQGAPQPQQAGAMPPEVMQMLQDPQIQQALVQNGLMIDQAGNVTDQASGQPLPPEDVMKILEQLTGGGQPPAEGGGEAPAGTEGQGAPADQGAAPDPMAAILGKLDEILAALKGGAQPQAGAPAAGGGEAPKEKKPSQSEKIDSIMAEMQRTNELLSSMTGQQ